MHIGSWKLHAAFLFKIAIIYFFVKPSFWKSKNTNRLHFWRGLRIFISFWFNQKKRSRYEQKKANSYKALKFEHAHLHVFHWTVGFFLHQYQPLKIKSIVFVLFNFENRSGIRIKLRIELCSSNFKNHVLFMLGAIIGAIIALLNT